ncbi:hypothetical protein B0A49_07293 [Cryomyces minteri]|uniref:ATP-dependent RNA helicase n=1 Tax=Cryomyces minteri TaxID=331657 RepID=A0A4U0X533_9PEZI|nr:hypothetical protein B0A49_07293 [Cryomyces minteri]
MADDGMLLNFSIGDSLLATKPTFRGGRWKDRLTARKAALHRQSKTGTEKLPAAVREFPRYQDEEADGVSLSSRPAKRQRVGEDFRPSSLATGRTNGTRNDQSREKPKQVISSLFTYNPTSVAPKVEVEAQDETLMVPSNAPLTSELDTFTSLGLSTTLASHLLNKLNIKAPTAIQKEAVTQLIKEDSDAFIQAETGSGKTLAYLLPIVQRIMTISLAMKEHGQVNGHGESVHRDSGLFAIVLAPTRELSKQISVVLDSLLRCAHWIVAGTVIGGEKKKSEKARLRKGLNILVATPGRLADHLNNTEALDVSNVRWLVLDEGDRLMELGFGDDIQKIVSTLNLRMKKTQTSRIPGLPSKRTTVLCSATMKMDVQRLGDISLKEAVSLVADRSENAAEEGSQEKHGGFSAPAQLKQAYAVVPAKLRLVTLVAILKRAFSRRGSVMKAIVFISCADSVDFHFEVFTRDEAEKPTTVTVAGKEATEGTTREDVPSIPPASQKYGKIQQGGTIEEAKTNAVATTISSKENQVRLYRLHGSLPQVTRTSTLQAFTQSKDASVLVCTDVAARGLDLPNVDFVVEYDPPFSKDDHLHRIGRTARAGHDGRALIFLQPGAEEGYTDILKEGRRDGGNGLTRHDANELLRKGFSATSGVVGGGNRDWEDKATEWQLDVERWALESPKHLEQARRAYQSHIRAYATHVAAEREIFNLKTLHLGHLAKAFALRDKPGAIKVPGLRPDKQSMGKTKEERRIQAKAKARTPAGVVARSGMADHEIPERTDEQEAKRKMRMVARAMGGASEFNLG